MSSHQTTYERRAARQRQLEMMEASASGVLPTMELDTAVDAGGFSIRQRNQETARRFLNDEDESMMDARTTPSTNTAHAALFGGPRDSSNLHAVNLMDHETGVYAESTQDQSVFGSSFVDSIFGISSQPPNEHDAAAADTDVYLGDGSKPTGRATRLSLICGALRKKNAQGRRLRYFFLGIFLFCVILSTILFQGSDLAKGAVQHAENSARYEAIAQAVILLGISHAHKFDDPTSAEYDALRWVAYSDPARLEASDPLLMQRYILAVFYYNSYIDFQATHGLQKPIEADGKQFEGVPVSGWHRRDYWLTEKGVCLWYGVSCEARMVDGVETQTYDDNAPIVALDLSFNELYGSLPREMKGLRSLEHLDLSGNKIKGSFPAEWGRMFMLRLLDLHGNQMTGSIPKEIGFLEGVHDLRLSNNQFQGTMPLDIERMYQIRHFNVESNGFTGEFPSVKNLKLLETLHISNNKFNKKISESFRGLENLRELHCDHNSFTGPIPHGLKDLQELKILFLQNNALSGPIPHLLFQSNSNLERINLEFNELSGDLPTIMGQLEKLITMKINDNKLGGDIPEDWRHMQSLKELHLHNNKIGGHIPDSLSFMPHLRELWLQNNKVGGKIPASLGSAKNLQTAYLDHNKLTGEVPKEISQLEQLTTLRLEENDLTGKVPDEVCAKLNQNTLLSFLSADCESEVDCECCSKCY
jgi:Leucine-rich repeat (LRR) protein